MKINSFNFDTMSSLNKVVNQQKVPSDSYFYTINKANVINIDQTDTITSNNIGQVSELTNNDYNKLAKKVDVTNCSAQEIHDLFLELYKDGKLTEKEYIDLSSTASANDFDHFVRLGIVHSGTHDTFYPTSNGRNWLECFKKQHKLESVNNVDTSGTLKAIELLQDISRSWLETSQFSQNINNQKFSSFEEFYSFLTNN